MRRTTRFLVLLTLGAGLLCACSSGTGQPAQHGGSQPAAGSESAGARPVRIGLITDQSRALALYGQQEINGFKLGLRYATGGTMQVAGRRIELIVRDDQNSAERARQLARELIEKEGAEILQCCASTTSALAVIEVARDHQRIVVVDPAAGPQITGSHFNRFVFRTGRNTLQDALTAGPYLVQHVGQQFVQLAPDTDFGKGSARSWRKVVEGAGGRFVAADVLVPAETTDFTPYLQTMLDRAEQGEAQVLIVSWAGSNFPRLFQQLQEQGVLDRLALATSFGDNATLPSVYQHAVGSLGVIAYHFSLPSNPVNDWLVAEHTREYGGPPDLFTAGGMAAAIAIVEALKRTGGDSSPEQLITALEGMSFQGPKGTYTFRKEDHQALQPMYMVRLASLDHPGLRFFELLEERSAQQTAPPIEGY